MPYTFLKALFGTLLFFTILSFNASDRRPTPQPSSPPDQSRTGSAENLPAGVERSDWQGILAAHEEWKHSIRSAEDEAITGVLINESLSGLSGGYNLPALTTTSSATLTIPVLPAR
jgi:hypothetical protein